MLNITVAAESAASPERVLALAGTDFSAQRAKVRGNVKESRLAVHERGATHVEVTEYGTGPAWFAWERSRYDWSQPDRIRQTIDSNVHRLERARAGLHLGAARAAAPRGRQGGAVGSWRAFRNRRAADAENGAILNNRAVAWRRTVDARHFAVLRKKDDPW